MAYRSTPATQKAKRERRSSLLAAAHHVVAEAGFGAASVKKIAARADVSAGTVYTYFGSREELLAQVFKRAAQVEYTAVAAAVAAAQEEESSVPQVTRELTAVVETFAHRALAGRTLAWALLIEPAGEKIDDQRLEFRRTYADLTQEIIARGIRTNQIPEQEVRIIGPGLIGLISEALTGPLSPEGDVPTTHLIEGVTLMCLRAVGGSE